MSLPGAPQGQFVPPGSVEAQTPATAVAATQPQAQAQVQDSTAAANNALYHFREMQRRLVEFVKKRVLLLEKGLNAEYQKEYFVSHYYICFFFFLLSCSFGVFFL